MFVFKSLILKRNKCAQKRKTLAEQGSVFIQYYSVPTAPPLFKYPWPSL